MTTRFLASALAAALAVAAVSTGAQADVHRAKAVRFADLDLDRSADGATLLDRIVGAARDVCEEPRSWLSNDRTDFRQCFRTAVDHAVDRVDERSVTDAYLARFRWAATFEEPQTLAQR